jgi:hypothetical protein
MKTAEYDTVTVVLHQWSEGAEALDRALPKVYETFHHLKHDHDD